MYQGLSNFKYLIISVWNQSSLVATWIIAQGMELRNQLSHIGHADYRHFSLTKSKL